MDELMEQIRYYREEYGVTGWIDLVNGRLEVLIMTTVKGLE